MKILDLFFNSLYIYIQAKDEDGSGAKAIAYVLSFPASACATAGVILLTHWLTPGILTDKMYIKVTFICLILLICLQRLFEEVYLSGRRPLPPLPTHKLLRFGLYLLGPVMYLGFSFSLLLCFRYT